LYEERYSGAAKKQPLFAVGQQPTPQYDRICPAADIDQLMRAASFAGFEILPSQEELLRAEYQLERRFLCAAFSAGEARPDDDS
jgi:hypothetical protein